MRKAALAVDAAIARGEDPGPLAGVPVTVKANVDQAGFATTNGVRLQRDLIAQVNSPVVDNLLQAPARSSSDAPTTPAFSYAGSPPICCTATPKTRAIPSLTPGGSSGGAAAAVATGIGHIAHGTDIGGSIRYPAYACGVHGLRPTLGRVAAYNASSPERGIGGAADGRLRSDRPHHRRISGWRSPPWRRPIRAIPGGRRRRSRDHPRRSAPPCACVPTDWRSLRRSKPLCWTRRGGWTAPAGAWRMIEATPPLREASDLQERLWLGDGFAALAEAAEREGDPGALTVVANMRRKVESWDAETMALTLVRRATLTREWLLFLEKYPVLLLPVSAELPFPDGLDLQGEAAFRRVWEAQLTQTSVPLMGLPGLTVSTGLVGTTPVGVQIIAGRYREDLCLRAGEAIEAGGVPPAPIDPVG